MQRGWTGPVNTTLLHPCTSEATNCIRGEPGQSSAHSTRCVLTRERPRRRRRTCRGTHTFHARQNLSPEPADFIFFIPFFDFLLSLIPELGHFSFNCWPTVFFRRGLDASFVPWCHCSTTTTRHASTLPLAAFFFKKKKTQDHILS